MAGGPAPGRWQSSRGGPPRVRAGSQPGPWNRSAPGRHHEQEDSAHQFQDTIQALEDQMTRNVRSKVPLSHRSIAARTCDTVLHQTTRASHRAANSTALSNGVQEVVCQSLCTLLCGGVDYPVTCGSPSSARVYSTTMRVSAAQRALMAGRAQVLPRTVGRCKAFVHGATGHRGGTNDLFLNSTSRMLRPRSCNEARFCRQGR